MSAESNEPALKRQKIEQKQTETCLDTSKSDRVVSCEYLDTVDRKVLDFDFEKNCSVCLSRHNVYGCLVCGRFFQGRGKNSHAYVHALQADHHVFINLNTAKIYCLPDGYEVCDSSLQDIQYNLKPTFSQDQIHALDTVVNYAHSLDDTDFLPGFIGLNNIKKTDWCNVIVQLLVHIPMIRDFFLDESNVKLWRTPVVQTFGELTRKIWSPRNFKGQVSPHEFLQAVSVASDKKYRIGEAANPLEFLAWTLHQLHEGIGGTHKPGSSAIHKAFQGCIRVEKNDTIQQFDAKGRKVKHDLEARQMKQTVAQTPFLFLTLTLPPTPLFKDAEGANIIPQVSLFQLLQRFDGVTEDILPNESTRKYSITDLPPYLIIRIKRYTDNYFFTEKNPTIVNFPVRNLDVGPYLYNRSKEELHQMSIKELKKEMSALKLDLSDCREKEHLVDKIFDHLNPEKRPIKYNLVGNACMGVEGAYKCQVINRANDQWLDLEDLHVQETIPQLVAVSETFIQVYELQPLEVAMEN